MLLEKEDQRQKTECLMNLSNEFFVQATMPSTEFIFLDIGLG